MGGQNSSGLRPDLICAWPKHVDFPLFRKMVRENRDRFNRVIVVFTNTSRKTDFSNFIKTAMSPDGVTFDESKAQGDQDWRNVAVNMGLAYSNSDWIFFTEQDFLPQEGFWNHVEKMVEEGWDAFGAFSETRLHPCCIFVKRPLVYTTNRYFGVVQDKLDHFGQFQQELEKLASIGEIPEPLYNHMNGLTQNMTILQDGGEPNFRPEEFKQYLKDCMELTKVSDLPDTFASRVDFHKLARKYLENHV